MSNSQLFTTALACFNRGDKAGAARLADQLICADYSPAHTLRGLIFEFGGKDVAINLEKALSHYRQAAYSMPSDINFLALARVLMKVGGRENYRTAYRYLEEASKISTSPEISLAYGKYYSTKETPNFSEAKHCYLRAAIAGRVLGITGYSSVLRKAGHRWRAYFVFSLAVVITPIVRLLLGKKSIKDF